MTLRCQEVLDRLVEGVTGSVAPGDRDAIREHLVICGRCRDEAAAIEGTAALLREAGRFTTPPEFWPGFMQQLNARIAEERLPMTLRLRRWLASPRHALGTAAVTALATVTILLAHRFVPPTPVAENPMAAQLRGLVTETMTTTLPSLGEMLETWRAGLAPETEPTSDRSRP